MKNVYDDSTLGNHHKLVISTSRLEMETFQGEKPLESQTTHEDRTMNKQTHSRFNKRNPLGHVMFGMISRMQFKYREVVKTY